MDNQLRAYKSHKQQIFKEGEYAIVPIREQDRYDIMKWRNEQLYHLRKSAPLTKENQDHYFDGVVRDLFNQDYPSQILFSYLKGDSCIGYGGLVHINWLDKNAEISFIINTALEKEAFHFHWKKYLSLIEELAFQELNLHKIYTYAFDLRPQLYEAIESARFEKEATLKEHCFFDGQFKDVLIHAKFNPYITYRPFNAGDKEFVYELNNDVESRKNSFYKNQITLLEHEEWFQKRLNDENSVFFTCESDKKSIGIVRFQKGDAYTTIGVNVFKEYRAKGLAKRFLKQCCQLYFEKHQQVIHAFIQPTNIASIKTFEKSGFTFKENTMVNEVDCLVYKLEKNG